MSVAAHGAIIFGSGRIATSLAEAVTRNPLLFLSAVVSTDGTSAQKLLSNNPQLFVHSEHPVALGYAQVEEHLNKNAGKITFALVASPVSCHSEHTEFSLNHGLHVFCEKPFVLKADEVRRLYKLASDKGKKILIGYNKRFDPSFALLQNKLEEQVGKIQCLRLTSRDHPAPPEEAMASTTSFFDDFSTHDFDMSLWLNGGERPEKVFAISERNLEQFEKAGLDDTAVIMATLPSGTIVIIENSRRSTYGYDQRLEVQGSKGMMQINNPSAILSVESLVSGVHSSQYTYSFPERYREAYYNEVNHLVTSAINNTQISVTENDILSNLDFVHKASASVASQTERKSNASKPKEFLVPNFKTYFDKVGVCLFGAGRMGTIRANALRENSNAQLLTVYDVDQDRAKAFAVGYNCKHATTIEEALATEGVGVVFVSSTASTHVELIEAAAKAGKSIFCEKPLAFGADVTEQLISMCAEHDVFIYCGLHRRSDPHYLNLANKIKKGDLGRLETLRVTSRDGAQHNSEAFLLSCGDYYYDSLIHDVDIACFFAQELPHTVYCSGTCFNETLKEVGQLDNIALVLHFPSGLLCTIDNNRKATYGYDQRAEAFGSKGMATVENELKSNVVFANQNGIARDTCFASGMDRYRDAYNSETNHFISGKTKSSESRVVPKDIVALAKILDAARASQQAEQPVTINY